MNQPRPPETKIEIQSEYLTEMAFLPAPTMSSISEKDYASIYGDEPYVNTFKYQEHKLELKEEDDPNIAFKYQYFRLIDALQQWAHDNRILTPVMINHFAEHKQKIFQSGYAMGREPRYIQDLKKCLENIYIRLNDPSINQKEKVRVFTSMADFANVCAPGLSTHFTKAATAIESNISLASCLAELRTFTVERYAEQHTLLKIWITKN